MALMTLPGFKEYLMYDNCMIVKVHKTQIWSRYLQMTDYLGLYAMIIDMA